MIMWILHTNGQKIKVVNEDHIKRLLSEGGQEIADPTQQEAPQEPEQPQVPSGEAGSEQTQEDKSAEQIGKPAQGTKKAQ